MEGYGKLTWPLIEQVIDNFVGLLCPKRGLAVHVYMRFGNWEVAGPIIVSLC